MGRILSGALVTFLAGCSGGITTTAKSAEELAAERMAHVHKVRSRTLQGKNLYDNNCSRCHEFNGAGSGVLTPPVYDAMASKSDKELFKAINEGTANAPTHKFGYADGRSGNRLTEDEQRKIVSYMRDAFGPLP